MPGLARAHHERMYDGIITGLPLYDVKSSVDFEDWVLNMEKNCHKTNYEIVELCYAKTTNPVRNLLEIHDPTLKQQQLKEYF